MGCQFVPLNNVSPVPSPPFTTVLFSVDLNFLVSKLLEEQILFSWQQLLFDLHNNSVRQTGQMNHP